MPENARPSSTSRWERWLATMSESLRAEVLKAMEPPEDNPQLTDLSRLGLAREALDILSTRDYEKDGPDPSSAAPTAQYHLVVAVDGEPIQVKKIDALGELIEQLATLNGTDAYVFIFYGSQLFFTRGDHRGRGRKLVLPDGARCTSIPDYVGGASVASWRDPKAKDMDGTQANCYIGPPELGMSVSLPDPVAPLLLGERMLPRKFQNGKKKDQDDDDEDGSKAYD